MWEITRNINAFVFLVILNARTIVSGRVLFNQITSSSFKYHFINLLFSLVVLNMNETNESKTEFNKALNSKHAHNVLPDETTGPQPRSQGLSSYRPLGAPSFASCGKMRDPGN